MSRQGIAPQPWWRPECLHSELVSQWEPRSTIVGVIATGTATGTAARWSTTAPATTETAHGTAATMVPAHLHMDHTAARTPPLAITPRRELMRAARQLRRPMASRR